MCKKFPLAICSDGRTVTKLPGGPTVGCQSWLLRRWNFRVFVALSKVYTKKSALPIGCRETRRLYLERNLLQTFERPRARCTANRLGQQSKRLAWLVICGSWRSSLAANAIQRG